ncbi:Putative F-box/LRR-repeat protein [Striga hermonthica]|uniref:F-box/LRR-repeat protein n=1 Tax=Striga hermonthica TaxID=68872 RepID=A0A9N7NFJ6_STRHE|nr:Putative F-box/LRR-repeat protein [Striga hermonthica]
MKAPRLMKDRISQLPQPILHRILDWLSQREAARTCTLSKSWRYIESTGPYFTMIEDHFNGSYREFINANERHLQLYHDHKICPQIIYVNLSTPGAE